MRNRCAHGQAQQGAAAQNLGHTRRYTVTVRFWPRRWQRSSAWRSIWGLKSTSCKMTVSARVKFKPCPPARVLSRNANTPAAGLLYLHGHTWRQPQGLRKGAVGNLPLMSGAAHKSMRAAKQPQCGRCESTNSWLARELPSRAMDSKVLMHATDACMNSIMPCITGLPHGAARPICSLRGRALQEQRITAQHPGIHGEVITTGNTLHIRWGAVARSTRRTNAIQTLSSRADYVCGDARLNR